MTIIDWLTLLAIVASLGAFIGVIAWAIWAMIVWLIAFINLIIDACIPDADEDTGGPI